MTKRRLLLVLCALIVSGGCSGAVSKPPAEPTTEAVAAETTSTTASQAREVLLDAASPLPCAMAVKLHDPVKLLSAFRAARLGGERAEDCMTAVAAQTYAEMRGDNGDLMKSPGPICLYRCCDHRVIALEAKQRATSPGEFQLSLVLEGTRDPTATDTSFEMFETVTIGSGRTASGAQADQAVTGVSNM